MIARRAVVAGGLWLAAVTLVAAVSWFAIDSAGRQVTSQPLGEQVAAASSTDQGGAGTATTTPAATTTAPTATSSVPPGPTGTPSAHGSASGSPEATSSAGEPSAPTHATSSPPPADVARSATKRVVAGSVTVECTGATITDWAVVPKDGWGVEKKSESATEVEVEFTGAGEVSVHGRCSGGRPVFEVSQEAAHGKDD